MFQQELYHCSIAAHRADLKRRKIVFPLCVDIRPHVDQRLHSLKVLLPGSLVNRQITTNRLKLSRMHSYLGSFKTSQRTKRLKILLGNSDFFGVSTHLFLANTPSSESQTPRSGNLYSL